MPISRANRPMPLPGGDVAPSEDRHYLRPYIHHGLDLSVRGGQAFADCPFPFCGKAGRFTVEIATGLWRCWSCGGGTEGGGGNALTFIRRLHEAAVAATPQAFLEEVALDRRLSLKETPGAWGVCQSPIAPHSWLIPGYSTEGRLDQLYKRTHILDTNGVWQWRLLPTPGVWPEGKSHALHLTPSDFDPTRPEIYVCEGPWDAMALWEVSGSRDGTANVLAAPGCKIWRDDWSKLCKDKVVTLFYDSDHPRTNSGREWRDGYDGMHRVARRLSGIAAEIRWVRWGPDGYDMLRPDGWDVRDHLSHSDVHERPLSMLGRQAMLADLFSKVEHAPPEWLAASSTNGRSHGSPDVEPEDCSDWLACEQAWGDALEWRKELGDVMAVMLAVAASTNQSGDNQLFLQVIGDPGSAKTRLCKGLLVSKSCKLLLHLKSFHSGWKTPGEEDKDCSLVARISGLCLVTPEADALHVGMNLEQINSQVRQIFDGESGSTYGNSDKDNHYKGLRSPWIQAGTPALMDKDQSRLGDRFLRIRLEQPDEEVKQAILMRALDNELCAVIETSNGTASSIIPPKLRHAYALTGGYVDWLRTHIEDRIGCVEIDMPAKLRCVDLAILTADMRARPNMDPKKVEVHHTKELPSRLVSQFGRLAVSLAVVLNKQQVDDEVLRIVRKVALDTAHGHTLSIVHYLCSENPRTPGETYQSCGGLATTVLEMWLNMSEDRLLKYLLFLRKIDVLYLNKTSHGDYWALTERIHDLYHRVMGV